MLDLSPEELLTTTRAVRKRMDFDRPVEREVVERCIEIGMQAPSGSNMQGWHWVVVTDREKMAPIGDYYRQAFQAMYGSMPDPEYPEGDSRGERAAAVRSSAEYLAQRMHEVPMMVIPCHQGRLDDANSMIQASIWGSIIPSIWNFQLALRAHGLGSVYTTLHLMFEEQVAQVLGIPFDSMTQAALIPVGHTKGTDFKPAPRNPASDVVHWNTW